MQFGRADLAFGVRYDKTHRVALETNWEVLGDPCCMPAPKPLDHPPTGDDLSVVVVGMAAIEHNSPRIWLHAYGDSRDWWLVDPKQRLSGELFALNRYRPRRRVFRHPEPNVIFVPRLTQKVRLQRDSASVSEYRFGWELSPSSLVFREGELGGFGCAFVES
jgi:hypothetical protein